MDAFQAASFIAFLLSLLILTCLVVVPVSLGCSYDLYSGWARLTHLHRRSPLVTRQGEYLATIECFSDDGIWVPTTSKPTVIRFIDSCPDPNNAESLSGIGGMMRTLCPINHRFQRLLSDGSIVRSADGSPVLVPESKILESVALGPGGKLMVLDSWLYPVRRTIKHSVASPREDLWVAWHSRNPNGTIAFQKASSESWRSPWEAPRASRTYIADRMHCARANASIELRKFVTSGKDNRYTGSRIAEVSVVPLTDDSDIVHGYEDTACGLCQLPLSDAAEAEVECCGHSFHTKCIEGVGKYCPLCAHQIRPARVGAVIRNT